MATEACRIQGLTFSYGESVVLAVDHIAIRPGAVTVITGPNASGKTTLLKLMAGLLRPSTGSVSCPGAVYVHASPPVIAGSVFHNAAYGPRARGMAGQPLRAVVSRALEAVGLQGQERRRASALSSGKKKLLGIARALAADPRVLLLDEPDAYVDTDSIGVVERVLDGLRHRGLTVVVSTHDPGFGYRMADEHLCLSDGRLVAGAVNRLRGRVEAREEELAVFRTGGVRIHCPARAGEPVVAVLPLDDVLLSLTPVATSARNRLKGAVASLSPEGTLWRVAVDCGIRIEAYVTGSAVRELDLRPGRGVWVSFKASAVSLY